MSEEPSVEEILDYSAAKRAVEAGIQPPEKVEAKGEATAPEPGEDDSAEAGEEPEDKGDKLEASEDGDSQDGASEDEDEGEKPKAKPQSRAQKRIRQLTRERDRNKELLAQREAELAAFARLADQKIQEPKPEPAAKPDADTQPKQEEYDDYAKYLADLSAWSAREAVKQSLDAERKTQAERQRETAAQAQDRRIAERVREYFAKGVEKYDDFDEVKEDYFDATETMMATVLESENAEDLHYYFVKNPDDAARIAKLSSIAQVRELVALEARLTPAKAEGKARPKPAAKKTTSAEPPLKPVKAGGAPRNFDPDTCDINEYMDEYARQRAAGRV